MDSINPFHYIAYHWGVSLGLTLAGLAFFGALTVLSAVRTTKRAYLPGLLLMDFGIVNSLVRILFFYDLSPHPTRPGGLWRLSTAVIIVCGAILLHRAWQHERARQRSHASQSTTPNQG
jgi:hypothetical protein